MCIGLLMAAMQATTQPSSGDTGKVMLTGWGAHETGQMYKIRWQGTDIPRQWLMREQANLTAKYIYNDYFRLSVGITGRMWFETYPDAMRNPANSPRKQYFSVYPSAAEGIFSYDRWNTVKVGLEAGYFPFKYNPDTRNLGEYLIRCGAYPPYIITNLDQTLSRLAGLHASATLWDMVHVHALFTQECEMPTFYDPSLSFLGDVNVKKIFEIGGGVMFSRFWPVNNNATAKNDPTNAYVDPSLPNSTGYYTFAGTKLMARASFDPKPLFGSFSGRFLGPNDLRIYYEAAILGLKNYPVYYDTVSKRIPIMIGFNVPTFKVFDVLAVEMENYNWNYSNGYQNAALYGTAVPGQALEGNYTAADYTKDNLKWTVYAKRTFFNHFSILLQFANDHLVLPAFDEKLSDREEVCGRPTSWYWLAKFGVNF
jgi:hypothetical protein